MAHLQGSNVDVNYVDKRRAIKLGADARTHIRSKGTPVFTANAAGSTTTIVGANATPSASTNVVRLGDEFALYTGAGALKEETIFSVTAIAVAASTTVTFAPAAAGATASGDTMRFVGIVDMKDESDLDARLTALGTWNASGVNIMNQNDKIFAVRTADDPESI